MYIGCVWRGECVHRECLERGMCTQGVFGEGNVYTGCVWRGGMCAQGVCVWRGGMYTGCVWRGECIYRVSGTT